MSEIDLIIKLRDAGQIISDACAEYLEKQSPKEKPVAGWDPSGIKWESAEGSKGPYERSEDVNNCEFKAMVKDLTGHGGRLTREGYFYWLFENGGTVGRKRRGKREAKTAEADIEAVKSKIPPELVDLLAFYQEGDYINIKPRQFLGSENFSRIAKIVRESGGEYVSAGRDSRFRIKK